MIFRLVHRPQTYIVQVSFLSVSILRAVRKGTSSNFTSMWIKPGTMASRGGRGSGSLADPLVGAPVDTLSVLGVRLNHQLHAECFSFDSLGRAFAA